MAQGNEFGWGHMALQNLHIRWLDFAEMSREEKLLTIASCAIQLEEEAKAIARAKG